MCDYDADTQTKCMKSVCQQRRAAEGPERDGCLHTHNLEALCKRERERELDSQINMHMLVRAQVGLCIERLP